MPHIDTIIIGIIVRAQAPSIPTPIIAATIDMVCIVPSSVFTSKNGNVNAAPNISIIFSSSPSLACSLTNLFLPFSISGRKNNRYDNHAVSEVESFLDLYPLIRK